MVNKRLIRAVGYLVGEGILPYGSIQKVIAEKMNKNQADISKALSGDEKILTKKFLKRFNESFDSVFDIEWLLAGEGSMLKSTSLHYSNTELGNEIANQKTLIETNAKLVEANTKLLDDNSKLLEKILELTQKGVAAGVKVAVSKMAGG
jgi:hypothetical protein